MVNFSATHDPVTIGSRFKGPYWRSISFLDYIIEFPSGIEKRRSLFKIMPDGDIFVNILFNDSLSAKKLLPIQSVVKCDIDNSGGLSFSLKFKYLPEPEDLRIFLPPPKGKQNYVVSTIDPNGIFLKGENIGAIGNLDL